MPLLGLLGAGSKIRAFFTIGLLVALGIAALGLWLAYGEISERDQRIGSLTGERDRAVDAAKAANQIIEKLDALTASTNGLRSSLDGLSDLNQKNTNRIIWGIRNDPNLRKPQGCPDLSPGMAATLDRLRQILAAPDAHGNQAGAGGNPGGPAPVPGR